ncbi:hypothetical protein AMJ80_07100 [bacterium SM23_31]|nr:MAG: hypothetical protein AMJ80_07100 [bacterium SM23_31]
MLLAVDIGNTNVVLGVFDDDTLLFRWRLDSHTRRTEDEWLVLLRTLFSNADLGFSDITGIAISSVVPGIAPFFIGLSRNHFKIEPLIISSVLDLGIVIKYDDPTAVGADRLCNAVAGYEMYESPLVIIDFGTATTYDIISGKGEYIGGIIAPGVETASQHLHEHAAKLPSVELRFPDSIIATNTERSMQVGIMYGAVASIEGIISRIKKELNEQAVVIATGGIAPLIIEKTPIIDHYEPDLTMIGMEKIYKRVKKTTHN